jgi:hypothetical protein
MFWGGFFLVSIGMRDGDRVECGCAMGLPRRRDRMMCRSRQLARFEGQTIAAQIQHWLWRGSWIVLRRPEEISLNELDGGGET